MTRRLCLCVDAVVDPVATLILRQMASTVVPVCTFTFRKSKVDQDSTRLCGVVQKVSWFHISVYNSFQVY